MPATTRVVTTVTNAATKTYSYSGINLLDEDIATLAQQLKVYLTPANTGSFAELTPTTDFTFAVLPTKTITLTGTVATNLAVGDIITIQRDTKDDARYIDFTGLAFLRSDDVDTNGDQLLFLIQEANTNVEDALIKTADLTKWQGEGLPSTNCGNAIDSTGWATLGQVVALISGGSPMDVGEGLYAEASGDGATDTFSIPTFPTTDINNAKIFVTIDGVVQRPGIDYSYTLSATSVPTVTFLLGAPPTGTNNIQFRVLPGVVTTTYAAASLDGDVIIDNTLDGDAIIDGTLDGDALINASVDLDKLTANSGSALRFAIFDASGAPTARTITNADVTHTGASGRTDITNSQIVEQVTTVTTINGTPYTFTNSGSTTLFGIVSISAQNGAGTVQLTPDSGSAVTLGNWISPGSAINNVSYSFFIPPGATVTVTGGASDRLRRFVTQEI